jgi:folate-dependent tRNA-U54 methylase TrmFO/GidA
MNINFGLLPPLSGKNRGRGKRLLLARRASKDMEEWKKKNEG